MLARLEEEDRLEQMNAQVGRGLDVRNHEQGGEDARTIESSTCWQADWHPCERATQWGKQHSRLGNESS